MAVTKRSKKYQEALKNYDKSKAYSIDEALGLVPKVSFAKFDETVDLAFRLGIDPRHADQMIRGAIALPAGTGKSLRVVVIASGDKITEAEKSGADYSGADELINKIAGGWTEFDRIIATPDMMGKIGKIGRILGPRGLMPNPKLGTVTTEVGKAVKEQKAGKVEYRTDKDGNLHVSIGKKSFTKENLLENFNVVVGAILRAKPASSKGNYLRSLTVSTTMGPAIKIDTLEVITKNS